MPKPVNGNWCTNGAAHYISLSWATTAAIVENSPDGSTWTNIYTGSATTYAHNTGAIVATQQIITA
ncbi:MAG: hypothetical protein U0V74_17600 [Chitinophagales bacterium]